MNKLNQIRHRVSGNLWQKNEVKLNLSQPIVTFTFDDFPKSAAIEASDILDTYSGKGTFYASMNLLESSNHLGEMFDLNDIKTLHEKGHEIGSHTFSHQQPHTQTTKEFDLDLKLNLSIFNESFPDIHLKNFSFPFGQANSKLKGIAKQHFTSSRGIYAGYHKQKVDLNLLKANKLYSAQNNINAISKLMIECARNNGWIIFYTHDVREDCSKFGCTPALFKKTVELANELGFAILSVDDVMKKLKRQPVI